mmetsp:Transcript_19427/g.58549  ORF Transcript_19427/g.58549 Transcript_19427/m.58549 type:complete len:202 (-) Transcript_19427:999-1604(-)
MSTGPRGSLPLACRPLSARKSAPLRPYAKANCQGRLPRLRCQGRNICREWMRPTMDKNDEVKHQAAAARNFRSMRAMVMEHKHIEDRMYPLPRAFSPSIAPVTSLSHIEGSVKSGSGTPFGQTEVAKSVAWVAAQLHTPGTRPTMKATQCRFGITFSASTHTTKPTKITKEFRPSTGTRLKIIAAAPLQQTSNTTTPMAKL